MINILIPLHPTMHTEKFPRGLEDFRSSLRNEIRRAGQGLVLRLAPSAWHEASSGCQEGAPAALCGGRGAEGREIVLLRRGNVIMSLFPASKVFPVQNSIKLLILLASFKAESNPSCQLCWVPRKQDLVNECAWNHKGPCRQEASFSPLLCGSTRSGFVLDQP